MGSQEINLITNYVSILTNSGWVICDYYVSFTPEVEETRVRKRLLAQHKGVLGPKWVFDGRMLFVPQIIDEVSV